MTAETNILWQADADRTAAANVTGFLAWLADQNMEFTNYDAVLAWSIAQPEAFWHMLWRYFDVIHDGDIVEVMTAEPMPNTRWFTGTRLNYAEHVLRLENTGDPDRVMLHHSSELRPLATMSWRQVAARVRRLASKLRELGLGEGDCIVAYMPNIPEAMIAMLATTAIGATWSSAAPEFGAQTVIDRFGQIAPKLIFAANGYRYGGKDFDRTADLELILKALPEAADLVMLDYQPQAAKAPAFHGTVHSWQDMLAGPEIKRQDFAFTRVASDHPLWVLFSSGTTGLPKPIVQGHHGIVVEHLKSAAFHFDLKPSDTLFFYSTTGWMMWNTLMWGPLMGASAVLYDGHPAYPEITSLFELAQNTGATVFGTNPTFLQVVKQQGIVPKERFDLSSLQSVILVGSPATPEVFEWVYDSVKDDIWVSSQSGGTEFCSGILAGAPVQPVRAGVIQSRGLATDAQAFGEDGKPIIGDVGELIIGKPMPSMPLFFWGDTGNARYQSSYFEHFESVWTHGDRVQFNADGTCVVLGRSDATLNRFGVRIGSAEIYRTVDSFAAVKDSLIVCVEDGIGGYFMPLFVELADGGGLTDTLIAEIRSQLRRDRSPRHVPDVIVAAPEIPLTLTGKKMEVPVRQLLLGKPLGDVASEGATRNPQALRWFAEYASQWRTKMDNNAKENRV